MMTLSFWLWPALIAYFVLGFLGSMQMSDAPVAGIDIPGVSWPAVAGLLVSSHLVGSVLVLAMAIFRLRRGGAVRWAIFVGLFMLIATVDLLVVMAYVLIGVALASSDQVNSFNYWGLLGWIGPLLILCWAVSSLPALLIWMLGGLLGLLSPIVEESSAPM